MTEAGTYGPSSPAPAPLRWAIGLLVGQAAAVALLAAVLLYKEFAAPVANRGGAWLVTGFAAAIAALLGLLAWALARRRAVARGPAIVMELMLPAVGYYMIEGGQPWLGVPVLLLGLTGAGLLLAPSTRQALGLPLSG